MPHVRSFAFLALLAGTLLPAAAQTSPAACPATVTQRIVTARVTNGQEIRNTATYPAPPGCVITNWRIGEHSRYGETEYTSALTAPDTLQVTYRLKSTFGLFTVHTASLELDLTASLAPAASASAPETTVKEAGETRPVQTELILLGLAALIVGLALVAVRTPGRNAVLILGIVAAALAVMYGFTFTGQSEIKIGENTLKTPNVGLGLAFVTIMAFTVIYRMK